MIETAQQPNLTIEDIEEQQTTYPARVTRPRAHTREAGVREIMIDRIYAIGEDLGTLERIVKAWIRHAPKYRSAKLTSGTERKRTFVAGERKMKEADIRSACLIKHKLGGDSIGVLLRRSMARIATLDGRMYEVDLKGKPLRICVLCKATHEPFDPIQKEHVHPGCIKRALREEETQRSQTLAERILEKAKRA